MNSTLAATDNASVSSNRSGSASPTAVQIQPYLFFGGRCDEAIEHYRRVLGAKVTMLMRFKDSPDPAARAAGKGEKVMHADIQIGSSTLLASDGCDEQPKFQGFSLSLSLPTTEEAERVFADLSNGGSVQQSMTQTFFATRFGMLTDRFGVAWMIMVPAKS